MGAERRKIDIVWMMIIDTGRARWVKKTWDLQEIE
jgi:hypothetical protein